MIVVTGATGALNGATVDHLLDRVPASEVAVVSRDPGRAVRFAERGVEVRAGGYAEADGLVRAFAGADQLLLVSSNDPAADAVTLHRAAIDAAVAAGVGRILYTSHQGAAADTPFRPGRDHAATEELLARSGLPWTSLRNGFYAHTLDWLLAGWRDSGVIRVPLDGPVSWTAREDLAEAAAVLLTADRPSDGPVTLTAAAAPTFTDLADAASDLAGRPVVCEVVGIEEWVAAWVAGGRPEGNARFMLGLFEAAQAGFFAGTSPVLGELLARAPRTALDQLAAPAAG